MVGTKLKHHKEGTQQAHLRPARSVDLNPPECSKQGKFFFLRKTRMRKRNNEEAGERKKR